MSQKRALLNSGLVKYRRSNRKPKKPGFIQRIYGKEPQRKVVTNRETFFIDNINPVTGKNRRADVEKMQDHKMLEDGTIDWDPRTEVIESPGALKGVVSLDKPGNREMNLEKDARGIRYSKEGTLSQKVEGQVMAVGQAGKTAYEDHVLQSGPESKGVERLAKGRPDWRPDGKSDDRLKREGRPDLWQVDV